MLPKYSYTLPVTAEQITVERTMKVHQELFVAFLFFDVVASTHVEEKEQMAYVLYDLKGVSCEPLPEDNPCRIYHQVISIGVENRQAMLRGISTTIQFLQEFEASDKCINSVRDTLCSGFMKCPTSSEKFKGKFDFTATRESCLNARKACPSERLKDLPALNCSNLLESHKALSASQGPNCVVVQPYPNSFCKLSGYKVKSYCKLKYHCSFDVKLCFKSADKP